MNKCHCRVIFAIFFVTVSNVAKQEAFLYYSRNRLPNPRSIFNCPVLVSLRNTLNSTLFLSTIVSQR